MQIIVVKIISIDVHNPILIYPSFSVVFSMKIIIKTDGKIIPIEVKADKNVTAKSLAYYRKQYTPQLSVRLSTLNMRKDDDLLNLPLYLVDKMSQFVSVADWNVVLLPSKCSPISL